MENNQLKSPASEQVTLVEVLELIRPYEEFVAVVQAAACRLEAEGVQALVTLQFYADPEKKEAGAIITFADSNHFMEHVNMITGWEEFHQLLRIVKPLDVRVYGKLSVEAEAWLRGINQVSKTFTQHVAGFVRPQTCCSPDAGR